MVCGCSVMLMLHQRLSNARVRSNERHCRTCATHAAERRRGLAEPRLTGVSTTGVTGSPQTSCDGDPALRPHKVSCVDAGSGQLHE